MLPFTIKLTPGEPIYEQIVAAVRRAVVTGQLRPGERFPSIRHISVELKVNPNTVAKAVAELTAQGLLKVSVGQGCFVGEPEPMSKGKAIEAIKPELEQLIMRARQSGMRQEDFEEAVRKIWIQTEGGKL